SAPQPECAVAVAEHDPDLAADEVGYGEIDNPIAVEVAQCNETRSRTNRNVGSKPERPVPIAKKDGNAIGVKVDHRRIGCSVAIEVAQSNGIRHRPDRKIPPNDE